MPQSGFSSFWSREIRRYYRATQLHHFLWSCGNGMDIPEISGICTALCFANNQHRHLRPLLPPDGSVATPVVQLPKNSETSELELIAKGYHGEDGVKVVTCCDKSTGKKSEQKTCEFAFGPGHSVIQAVQPVPHPLLGPGSTLALQHARHLEGLIRRNILEERLGRLVLDVSGFYVVAACSQLEV